jgi:hypothetical protein
VDKDGNFILFRSPDWVDPSMRFLEWWASLSASIRYPVAVLIIGVSTVGFAAMHSYAGGKLLGLGWALGFILLFYGPSDADRKGYHL